MSRATLSCFIALVVAACGAPPQIESFEVEQNPSGRVPLGALAKVRTDVPSTVVVTVSHGGSEFQVRSSGLSVDHEIIVVGLLPDSEHSLRFTATAENGYEVTSPEQVVRTDALPQDFPPFEVTVSRPDEMEPGVTIVPVFRRQIGANGMDDFGMVAALDAEGQVIWYFTTDHTVGDLVPTPVGTFVYQKTRSGMMVEIDLLGRQLRHWHTTRLPKEDIPAGSIPVDADTFHHDMVFMPSGNFLMLSTEARDYEEYPSSDEDPRAPRKRATVIGDVVLEFTPGGEVLNRWHLLDLLDPMRIGYDSLATGFYREAYKDVLDEPGYDWSHCNSIDYDPQDHAALISCRPLDVVVKLDLHDGALEWLLGPHKGWREAWQPFLLDPVADDFLWNAHQHAAKVGPRGKVLMFDNGNHRAVPFDPKMPQEESFSRAVEFSVDEQARTVAQTWSFGEVESDRFFSSFISAVEYLPQKDNILLIDGARQESVEIGGESKTRNWARVVELTHTQPARKVFEVVVAGPDASWLIYRSRRRASLYQE